MAKAMGWRVWRHGKLRESFSSSLRIALAMAAVVIVCLTVHRDAAIIPLLLGVIASALAETDDTWQGRLRAQLVTLACFALVALSVQASFSQPLHLMLVFAGAAFLLTLFGAIGDRYRAVATATLIMSIYAALALQSHANRPVAPDQVVLLLSGAAWFGVISVAWAARYPQATVDLNLARLYESLGTYLTLKARLFEPVRGIDREQRRLALALHNGRVVEALNATKESLFSHMGVKRGPAWAAIPLHRFFVAQDVHERASSSHESYGLLADTFFHSDVLYRCEHVVLCLGEDCRRVAEAIRRNDALPDDAATGRAMDELEAAIANVERSAVPVPGSAEQRARRALRALATNLGAIHREVAGIVLGEVRRMPADKALQDTQPRSLAQAARRLTMHLTLRSPIMRHAIRLAAALATGHALMLVTGNSHGFWIPLTIVFVCQPYYGATLQRLVQRIGGTVVGLVVGWALLTLFPGTALQSVFTVVSAVLFFSFRPSRYALATAAITVFVLLSLNHVGGGYDLIVPRLLDTLAGSLIAGIFVLLVLPSWNGVRLPRLAAETLRAQAGYLGEIMAQYGGDGKHDNLSYRVARRAAHNADAALSGALAAALEEPEQVQKNIQAGTRFLVLSHTLLNYLSALGAHRSAQLEATDKSFAAARCLERALDETAAALEVGRSAPESTKKELCRLKEDLGRSPELEADVLHVVHAQLSLALGLVPALREVANDLGAV